MENNEVHIPEEVLAELQAKANGHDYVQGYVKGFREAIEVLVDAAVRIATAIKN